MTTINNKALGEIRELCTDELDMVVGTLKEQRQPQVRLAA